MDELTKLTEGQEEEDWLSVSDLMAGLLMIFILIAILSNVPVTEREAQNTGHEIKEIIAEFKEIENDLYAELLEEFKDDLPKWNAELDRQDLTFRFKAPEVLFDAGEFVLKEKFRDILMDFFPRYLKILYGEKYRNDISEIRIEGHTSSEWGDEPKDEAYFLNMSLSQGRTREVLKFILSETRIDIIKKDWAQELLTANGLSSSRIIKRVDDTEDKTKSRRVEFKIRTKGREEIYKVIWSK